MKLPKTILVTGTRTGFGKLTAISLAKEGHSVVAAMRGVSGKNAASAEELAALLVVPIKTLWSTS